MASKNRIRKIRVGLVGRIGGFVQLAEVDVHARYKCRAEKSALRIFRRVVPKAKWEAIAL